MTEVEKAVFLMALVRFDQEWSRVTAVRDMGPMCKNDCYYTAQRAFDRSFVPWTKELTA